MIVLLGLAAVAAATGVAAGKWAGPTVKGWFAKGPEASGGARKTASGGRREYIEYREVVKPSNHEQRTYDAERTAGGCSRPVRATHSAGGPDAATGGHRWDAGDTSYWAFAEVGDGLLGTLDEDFADYFQQVDAFNHYNPPTEATYVPAQDEVFENANEVFYEPDQDVQHVYQAGGPDDVSIVKRGILPAVQEGSHDPPVWVQLSVGDYELMVTAEPLAVSGIRLPTSFKEQIEIAVLLGALPITKAVSDARWTAGKRVLAQPLNDASGARLNDPSQVIRYNATIGPNTGGLTDGYQKESVLHTQLASKGRGAMAQYGFRKKDGSTYQAGQPGDHDEHWKDYSNTPTYMSNQGLYQGQPVDMIDELERGGPLGGPIPKWLANRLRGGGGVA